MDRLNIDSLRTMIGRKVSWLGGSGVVVELLEDGPSLVIRMDGLAIQADSLGYPRRKANETVLIQVYNPEGSYSLDFLEIMKP